MGGKFNQPGQAENSARTEPSPPSAVKAYKSSLDQQRYCELHGLLHQLAALQTDWERFADIEDPAFKAWFAEEHGGQLQEIQELHSLIVHRQLLIEAVHQEMILSQSPAHEAAEKLIHWRGLSPRESKTSQGLERTNDEPQLKIARRLQKDLGRLKGDLPPDFYRGYLHCLADSLTEQIVIRTKKKISAPDLQVGLFAFAAPDSTQSVPAKTSSEDRLAKDAYRHLARMLHPDLGKTSTPLTQCLWAKAQLAEKQQDVACLKIIAALCACLLDRNLDTLGEENTETCIRILRKTVRDIQVKVHKVMKMPSWGFSQPDRRVRLKKEITKTLLTKLTEARETVAEVDQVLADLRKVPRHKLKVLPKTHRELFGP